MSHGVLPHFGLNFGKCHPATDRVQGSKGVCPSPCPLCFFYTPAPLVRRKRGDPCMVLLPSALPNPCHAASTWHVGTGPPFVPSVSHAGGRQGAFSACRGCGREAAPAPLMDWAGQLATACRHGAGSTRRSACRGGGDGCPRAASRGLLGTGTGEEQGHVAVGQGDAAVQLGVRASSPWDGAGQEATTAP